MGFLHARLVLGFVLALTGCSGTQRGGRALATQCEIQHSLQGGDTVDGRIDRIEDGWLLTLRMQVHMGTGADAVTLNVQGLGTIRRTGSGYVCRVTSGAATDAGAPGFDEELCLDEFDFVADVLEDAEQSARPGETVVQEVSLRSSRRRRSRRSRLSVSLQPLQEHAEVARDADGRVVRVARNSEQGTREEVRVVYPPGAAGHCVRTD
jgi:hypothetical protein